MESVHSHEPWNKGKLVGQKPPLKPKDIWAIRIHLQLGKHVRVLALFNFAIDSKLRGCDLLSLRVRDVAHGNQILPRAMVMQRKTQRSVQFELTEPTREAVAAWITKAGLKPDQFLFPSRLGSSPHLDTNMNGLIVTLTGPSCAGKSTVEKRLESSGFGRILSTTTRLPRAGEQHGVHYNFVTREEFEALRAAGMLVEHVQFNGNRRAWHSRSSGRRLPVLGVKSPLKFSSTGRIKRVATLLGTLVLTATH